MRSEKIDAEVEYSDNVQRIIELGLMRSPLLVVDGRVADLQSTSEKDVRSAILGTK